MDSSAVLRVWETHILDTVQINCTSFPHLITCPLPSVPPDPDYTQLCEGSEKDGIIKRKFNLSFGVFIDLGEGGRQCQAAQRLWPMEPSEDHV